MVEQDKFYRSELLEKIDFSPNLEKVNRELGTTTAVITHNAAIAAMADRVIRMQSSRIVDVHRNLRKASPAELEW